MSPSKKIRGFAAGVYQYFKLAQKSLYLSATVPLARRSITNLLPFSPLQKSTNWPKYINET
jgi:hypothetical protein